MTIASVNTPAPIDVTNNKLLNAENKNKSAATDEVNKVSNETATAVETKDAPPVESKDNTEKTANQVKDMASKNVTADFDPTSAVLPDFQVQPKTTDNKASAVGSSFTSLEDATKAGASYSGTVAISKNDDGTFSLFKASKDQMDKITADPNYSGKVQKFITQNDSGASVIKDVSINNGGSAPAMTTSETPKSEVSTPQSDDKNLPAVMLTSLKGNEMRDVMNLIAQNPKGFQDNLDKIIADPKVSEPTKQFFRDAKASLSEVMDTAKNGGDLAGSLSKVSANGQSIGQVIQKAYVAEEVYNKFSQEKGGWFSKSPASHLEGVVSDYDTQFKKLQAASPDGKVTGEKVLNEISKSGKESSAVSSINSSLKNQKEFNDTASIINSKANALNTNMSASFNNYLKDNPNIATVDLSNVVLPGNQLTTTEQGAVMNFTKAFEAIKSNKFGPQEVKVFNDIIAMQSKLNITPEQKEALGKLKPLVDDYNTKVGKFQADYNNLTQTFGKMNESCDKLQLLINKAKDEIASSSSSPEAKDLSQKRLDFLEKLAATASKIPQNNDIQKTLYSVVLEKVLNKVESGKPEDWGDVSKLGKNLTNISRELPKIIKAETAANPDASNESIADKILSNVDIKEILQGSKIKPENIRTLLEGGSYISDVKSTKDTPDATQAPVMDYFSDFSNMFSNFSMVPGLGFMAPFLSTQFQLGNTSTDGGAGLLAAYNTPIEKMSLVPDLKLNTDLSSPAMSVLANKSLSMPSLSLSSPSAFSSPKTSESTIAGDQATSALAVSVDNLEASQHTASRAVSQESSTDIHNVLAHVSVSAGEKLGEGITPNSFNFSSLMTSDFKPMFSDISKSLDLTTKSYKSVSLSSDQILKAVNKFETFQALSSMATKFPSVSKGNNIDKAIALEMARIHNTAEGETESIKNAMDENQEQTSSMQADIDELNKKANDIASQEIPVAGSANGQSSEDAGDTIGESASISADSSGNVTISNQPNQAADLLRKLRGIIKKLDKELGVVKKEVVKKNRETQNTLNMGFNDMLKFNHLDMEKAILNDSANKNKSEIKAYAKDVEKFRKLLEGNGLSQFAPAFKGIESDLMLLSKS